MTSGENVSTLNSLIRRITIGTAVGLLTGLGAGSIFTSPPAAGVSASNYQDFPMGDGDLVANYDVDCSGCGGGNVDWPVDMIYWGNASRPTVGAAIESATGYHNSGGPKYSYTVNVGGGSGHQSDGGVKYQAGFPCADNTYHTRIYSDPTKSYNYNSTLGFYVWATSHADWHEAANGFEWLCNPVFGDNELAENFFSNAISSHTSWTVNRNAFSMNNVNNTQVGNHHFYNNGNATKVHVD
jgi:hypothetical protein